MRTPSRKLRPFRPATLSLESISPVSSLAIAMPPAPSPAAGQAGTTTARVDQPTRFAAVPSSLAASPSQSPRTINKGGGGSFGSAVATTSPIAMPQAAAVATVDIDRYADAITIASANVPSARPTNNATSGGGGAGAPTSMAGQTANRPAAAAVSDAASPPPIVQPATIEATASPAQKIRPMTLAAIDGINSPDAQTGSSSGSSTGLAPSGSGSSPEGGSGSGSNSSGGSTPTDEPPVIFASGDGDGASLIDPNVPGHYQMAPNPIPIGTLMDIQVQNPPNGQRIDPTTIKWSGGSVYSGYYGGDASQDSPPSLYPQFDVQDNQASYNFVVDADTINYTVTVSVNYIGGGSGTSDLKFTTSRPTTATLSRLAPAPSIKIGTAMEGAATTLTLDTMTIQSQTQTNATAGGDFAYVQLVNSYSFYTDPDGTKHVYNTNGYVKDTGTVGNPLMPFGYWNQETQQDSWYQGPNAPPNPPGLVLHTMIDRPSTVAATTSMAMGDTDEFQTYLMYRPAGGVWIAVSEIDWSWSQNLSKGAAGGWTRDNPPSVPAPVVTTPSGEAVFPSWPARSSDFGFS